MSTQNIQLNIGDKIGFVILASGIDEQDKTQTPCFSDILKVISKGAGQ